MSTKFNIGAAVRSLREQKRLTQFDLATAAGFSDPSGVGRIERGTGYSEVLERLDATAGALGVTLEVLIGKARVAS